METTTAATAAMSQFTGMGGAAIVSIIAFTIVFIVLAGLTAVIYAIKFISGGESAPADKGNSAASAPKPAAPAPVSGSKSQITAAIAAAILSATGGRGRILSITPSSTACCDVNKVWRTAGIIERISGRLSRPWKH